MNLYDFWTEEEVNHICMYYGQIPDNLPYNLKAILVEKFENEWEEKIDRVIEQMKNPN